MNLVIDLPVSNDGSNTHGQPVVPKSAFKQSQIFAANLLSQPIYNICKAICMHTPYTLTVGIDRVTRCLQGRLPVQFRAGESGCRLSNTGKTLTYIHLQFSWYTVGLYKTVVHLLYNLCERPCHHEAVLNSHRPAKGVN